MDELGQVKAEIRTIQSKIQAKRASLANAKKSSPRKNPIPKWFPGISEEHLELLSKLDKSISAKEAEIRELSATNADLTRQIHDLETELSSVGTQLCESNTALKEIVPEKSALRSSFDHSQRQLSTTRIAIQSLKRQVRTTDAAFVNFVNDRDAIESHPDIQFLRRQLTVLETQLRIAESQNSKLEEEIRLLKIEISTPLPCTSVDDELFAVFLDPSAEYHGGDLVEMKRELKAKEREFCELEATIRELHSQICTEQLRFDVLWDLSSEHLTPTTRHTAATVDQLIAKLKSHESPVSSLSGSPESGSRSRSRSRSRNTQSPCLKSPQSTSRSRQVNCSLSKSPQSESPVLKCVGTPNSSVRKARQPSKH